MKANAHLRRSPADWKLRRHRSLRRALLLGAALAPLLFRRESDAAPPACPALLSHVVPRLQDETPQDLCRYAGQVLLVVNTASYCGFTPQYEGLEELHRRYQHRGFSVLGFPSNDFQQEPGDNTSIAAFCFNTYGVKFPMFAKTTVAGAAASPFFAALSRAGGGAPKWNFYKYLIDRQGRVAAVFPGDAKPLDRRITGRIEQLLDR